MHENSKVMTEKWTSEGNQVSVLNQVIFVLQNLRLNIVCNFDRGYVMTAGKAL